MGLDFVLRSCEYHEFEMEQGNPLISPSLPLSNSFVRVMFHFQLVVLIWPVILFLPL
jgi:hypothetical protein